MRCLGGAQVGGGERAVGGELLGDAAELPRGELQHARVVHVVHEVGRGVVSWLSGAAARYVELHGE